MMHLQCASTVPTSWHSVASPSSSHQMVVTRSGANTNPHPNVGTPNASPTIHPTYHSTTEVAMEAVAAGAEAAGYHTPTSHTHTPPNHSP